MEENYDAKGTLVLLETDRNTGEQKIYLIEAVHDMGYKLYDAMSEFMGGHKATDASLDNEILAYYPTLHPDEVRRSRPSVVEYWVREEEQERE